jgi:hypothetical protein
MSVSREDKDGAERWWKSLFCHGQKPALAQASRISLPGPHNSNKKTALNIDIGGRIAISEM